jgi:hypothetical protein
MYHTKVLGRALRIAFGYFYQGMPKFLSVEKHDNRGGGGGGCCKPSYACYWHYFYCNLLWYVYPKYPTFRPHAPNKHLEKVLPIQRS